MDEQFDKHIASRVKHVFENYDDPLAHEGWLKLRKKFPETRRRRPVAWWWLGTAAALLLFFGIGLWINKQQVSSSKLIAKKINTQKTEQPGSVKEHKEENGSTGQGSKPLTNEQTIAATTPHDTRALFASQHKASARRKNDVLVKAAQHPVSGNVTGENIILPKQTVDSINHPAVNIQEEQLANIQSKIIPADSAAHIAPKSEKSINSMFANDQQLSKSNNTEKQKSDAKKVRFAVYAATYFNYAKGSDNQVNIGAGFTSDISLAKNLKLVTGVSIGQNSLNYSSSSSFNAAVPASASLLTAAASSYYSSYNTSIKTAAPTLKNYNASLVGLDIPMNLKYSFDPKKSDTYVLAGLSSGTFINETYTSQFNYPAQQTQEQVSRNNFNGVYFAKTLNLAFGTGFNMGKNRIIVEPFLKYPLDGLGSQQLRFGAGGLNLKFNFQPSKK